MPAKTHGFSSGRRVEYAAWKAMKNRCSNPNFKQWTDYGGRGIKVCEQWKSDFLAFYAAVGARPGPGYMLDRIDNNRGYEPGNVRWATRKISSLNRRCAVIIEGDPVAEVSRTTGIKIKTLHARIRKGMSPADAARLPVNFRWKEEIRKQKCAR